MEIYNEKIYDLLDSSGDSTNHLLLRETGKSVIIEGVKMEPISSPQEAYAMLARGYTSRHVGSTKMNRESSRSHTIFQLFVTIQDTEDTIKQIDYNCNQASPTLPSYRSEYPTQTSYTPNLSRAKTSTLRTSKFSIVDLAGSERHADTNSTGSTFREACHINSSLLVLGKVIEALSKRSCALPSGRLSKTGLSTPSNTRSVATPSSAHRKSVLQASVSHPPTPPHSRLSAEDSRRNSDGSVEKGSGTVVAQRVPYRESKLTMLLKDSLGGNSKVSVVLVMLLM